MTCEQAELRMAELLAGEIAPAERAALERHLLDCTACRDDFEVARAGARVEWADVPVPKELIESTLAAFRRPPAAVRFFRWATAAAALFGVAVLLLTSSRAPKPVTSAPPEPRPQRREVLATMQDAVVGALVCKDEDGRPVGELGLKSHDVTVEILDGIAKTTVEENFENHTERRLEGTFTFPLPSDASISRLALEVNGKIQEGTCLERERAREVFESIVRRMQDPALLEWQPGGFFKCRVFPIEPRATKRVIVAYTQALPCFRGKMTYVYPLASEKTRTHPPEELRIALQARFSGALSAIESPSHRLDVQRKNANEASMSFRAANYRPNNDFVVTMEPADEELRVVSQRAAGEDGYFACFLTPRGGAERAPGRYAFVLDVSASTSAPRLEVARRLVRAMMERRIAGDRFEILAHHIEVERSGEVDLRAANSFMDRLQPIGGSDVLRALEAAPADAETIYIGKGSPTFGESDSAKILEAMKGRRIRTVAVGSDANVLLLEKLGGMMRVNPNDDVGKRVQEIAATIGSPLLSELKVEGEGVSEVVGARDLFYGERLLVSGRYREGASKLTITGRGGYRRELEVAFPAKEEGNNYVRRLWAQRKVADLLARGEAAKAEVTALGVMYQIMTPYTSFLVLENEQMWKDHQLKREVQKQDQLLSAGDRVRGLFDEATELYRQGKSAEAAAKFEEAFGMKPSSDQVYACLRRAGEDMVARIVNDPDRKLQDLGRRLMELSKPGELLREGQATVQNYIEELKNQDHAVWRNSFWHLKNVGPSAVKDLVPALGDKENERYRSRVMLLMAEIGVEGAPAIAEALQSPDPFVRQNAAIVLGNVKDGRSLGALQRRLADPNETAEVKKFAKEALQKITRNPEEPTPEAIEKARLALVEEERARDEYQRLVDLKRERELLFGQAQLYFEREDFARAIESCDKILQLNPNLSPLQEMKNVAQRLQHSKSGKEGLKSLAEGWKREFDSAEAAAARQLDLLEVSPQWKELIAKRQPKGLAQIEAEEEAGPVGALRPVKPKTPTLVEPVKEPPPQPKPTLAPLAGKGPPADLPKEDPKAREIREAYEEQLRRDKQEVTINAKNASVKQIVDEYRRQTGWNMVVDFKKIPEDYRIEERRITQETDKADFDVWPSNSLDFVALPTVGGDGRSAGDATVNLHGFVTNVTAPGAPITDALALNGWWANGAGVDIINRANEAKQTKNATIAGEESEIENQRAFMGMLADRINTLDTENSAKAARIDILQRQMAAQLRQDLAELDETRVVMAREKRLLEEKINSIDQAGGNVNVAPKKALEAKVTAVAGELGLVVFSIGKDDGVLEGDEFTVYRGGEYVSKIVVDRADRKWAAGKIVLKRRDPRVADDVSNHIYVSGPRVRDTRHEVAAVEGSLVRCRQSTTAAVGDFLTITRDSKFVAILRVEKPWPVEARGVPGLSVGRVLPGDKALWVEDLRAYLGSLPAQTRMDLASRSALESMRAKMGMKQ
jgi:HEAT repeat protein